MLDALIVGAGPAGVGLLSSIYQLSKSNSRSHLKMCILDQEDAGNIGNLEHYILSSDTRAEKFLTCLEGLPSEILADKELTTLTHSLQTYGSRAVPLSLAGKFIKVLGNLLMQDMKSARQLKLKLRTKVVSATWRSNHWQVKTVSSNGSQNLYSKHLVLACGASESREKFDHFLQAYDLTVQQLSSFCLSSKVLKAKPDAAVFKKLRVLDNPKVIIVGGSHSAISVAAKLLLQKISFSKAGITIFHRDPMYATFESTEDALSRGFRDFRDEDVCPISKRVFALKGFRLDSRDLLMAVQGYDDGPLEKRVKLSILKVTNTDLLQTKLQNADLVVSALGYLPNYIPLYQNNSRNLIYLKAPNYVNEKSQLRDHKGSIIPNCYALGLASNYNLAKRFGEPSFRGQANGLVLWHKEIGKSIAASLMNVNI